MRTLDLHNRIKMVMVGIVLSSSLYGAPVSTAEESCVFVNEDGTLETVRNPNRVPRALKSRLVCKDKELQEVASPEDLDVGKDARTAQFSTELGPMKVRWSRSIERCFATPPARAVGEAAAAVNRALKSGRFTSEARYSRREWTLGFIDKTAAISQFPLSLTAGRHPGFMIPPNRIYIVPDHISAGCGNQEIADDMLIQVLLHEMGHVVEYILLGERQAPADRERSEGFAVWFEQHSADYASSLPKGQVRAYYAALARLVDSARQFTPDPQGYANAGMRFQTIVDRKGVSGLMSVYTAIREQHLPFDAAVERALGWDRATFERQVKEFRKRTL